MPVTIAQLNEKYTAEDPLWEFKLFPGWLTKKGILGPIMMETLKQVLVDFAPETLPATHREFDQAVLKKARELTVVAEDIIIQTLQEQLDAKLTKYEADWNALSRTKKIWEVLRGRA